VARQEVVLGKMTIEAGKRHSGWFDLYSGPGTAAVVTIYGPMELTGNAVVVEVSAGSDDPFRQFVHKGTVVRIGAGQAVDLPLPACRKMRVHASDEQAAERHFAVLALLEMD